MCAPPGIVGPAALAEDAAATLDRMLEALRHRGPDDGFVRAGRNALLAVRRLSIVDLLGGRQPVTNERGDVTRS